MTLFPLVFLLGVTISSAPDRAPKKPALLGVFVGRTPCRELAKELQQSVASDCSKLKWRLMLFQDRETHSPTTYRLEGTPYRQGAREGKWALVKGTPMNADALIYQLDPDRPERSLYLLKGDDNVLFILDKNRQFLVGNGDYGYTLNRVVR